MTFVETLLEFARNQVGIKEATGNNDGTAIAIFTGGRKEPWCAHFVAWCYRTAGKPIPGDIVPTETKANPLASVSHMERVFKDLEWLYREPKVGDVVFFKSRGGSDSGPGRHVGLVESIDVKTGSITTIEGNLSNAVKRTIHKLDNPRISGFGRLP